jgi:uncharacterized glyoxalase superfamily protein PhnB
MFDPSRGYPSVVPYFRYVDPKRAITWLIEVLGAREALRLTIAGGQVGHCELVLGSAVVSVGLSLTAPPEIKPDEDRHTLRQMTLVFVDDVDAVASRALLHGGSIIDPPTDQPWGLRQAIIRDLEGYLWEPAQHVGDVAASAWGAELVGELPG